MRKFVFYVVMLFLVQIKGANSGYVINNYIGDVTCPTGTSEALEASGLGEVKTPLCVQKIRDFKNPDASLVAVVYQRVPEIRVPVLFFANGNKYVFPPAFIRFDDLEKYATELTSAPIRNMKWLNMTLDNLTDQKVISKDGQYCIEYDFKYPWIGQIQQCPKMGALKKGKYIKEAYTVDGSVSYVEGAFTWKNALEFLKKECLGLKLIQNYENYHCELIREYKSKEKPSYWKSWQNRTMIAINPQPNEFVKYYVFEARTWPRGKLLAQVFPDGSVKSKIIPYASNLSPSDLLDLLPCLDKNDLNGKTGLDCEQLEISDEPDKEKTQKLVIPVPR